MAGWYFNLQAGQPLFVWILVCRSEKAEAEGEGEQDVKAPCHSKAILGRKNILRDQNTFLILPVKRQEKEVRE